MHMSGNRRAHESNPVGMARGPKNGRGPPAPRKAPRKAGRRHACFRAARLPRRLAAAVPGARCAAGAAATAWVGRHFQLTTLFLAQLTAASGQLPPGWARRSAGNSRSGSRRLSPASQSGVRTRCSFGGCARPEVRQRAAQSARAEAAGIKSRAEAVGLSVSTHLEPFSVRS